MFWENWGVGGVGIVFGRRRGVEFMLDPESGLNFFHVSLANIVF